MALWAPIKAPALAGLARNPSSSRRLLRGLGCSYQIGGSLKGIYRACLKGFECPFEEIYRAPLKGLGVDIRQV